MTLRRDFVMGTPRFCVPFVRRLTGVSKIGMLAVDTAINKATLLQESFSREGDVILPVHGLVDFFATHTPVNKKADVDVEQLFAYLDEVTKADPECDKRGTTIRICVRDDADGPRGLYTHLKTAHPSLFTEFAEPRTFDR